MTDERQRAHLRKLSRREFFRGTTGAAAGAALGMSAFGQNPVGPLRGPRVVRAFDQNATSWDYQANYYFDFIDQAAVDAMFQEGLQSLTHASNPLEACHRMMPTYVHGDLIAIKLNMNNNAGQTNQIDATAPVLNAVLRVLVDILGVPAGNIYVYDVSRGIPSGRIRNRVPWRVVYVPSGHSLAALDVNAPIDFRGISTQYCPKVLTRSQHLINIPLFKDHLFCLGTMGMKNHFGTTRPGPQYLHSPIHLCLSDLNATPHIRDKTRLVVGDALFGVYTGGPGGVPQQWATFPGGPTPNSIFLGLDPIATESVMTDYLIDEQVYRGINLLSHHYLHDAMDYHRIGVHEHRQPDGKYRLIDYVELDLT